jgi:hypothetical protein
VAQLDASWGWGAFVESHEVFVSKMMEIPEYPKNIVYVKLKNQDQC